MDFVPEESAVNTEVIEVTPELHYVAVHQCTHTRYCPPAILGSARAVNVASCSK